MIWTKYQDPTQLVQYLNHHAQILFLIMDNTGIIQHANRFADHYIGGPVTGKPFQRLIRDFHQTFQLDQAATCPDTVHLLEFDTPSGLSQTCRFHFYASSGHILALGQLDVEEISTLSDELVALNQELNNLTRQLNVKNRELTKANKTILELTRIDPLTGLANRRFFSERIQEMISLALRRSQPLSLIMTDIDHFKRVNDTWGHDAGDRVLKAYADLMKTRTRAEDLVARFGGEEFIILMPLADVHEAFAYAERIRCALAKADLLESGDPVTASFGVAGLVFDETGDDIIKRADTALYQAKASGRNRIVIASETPLKNGSDSL
jgi:diguanylate cyclase (GGDEF)-like protein